MNNLRMFSVRPVKECREQPVCWAESQAIADLLYSQALGKHLTPDTAIGQSLSSWIKKGFPILW